MPGFSSLRAPLTLGVRTVLKTTKGTTQLTTPGRCMSGHGMDNRPSRFSWERMKDEIHYFILIGVIPLGAIITYTNLFIGPAELRDIPEGYVPEAHEYIRHPISRWLQKNCMDSYEKIHERNLYYLHVQHQKYLSRLIIFGVYMDTLYTLINTRGKMLVKVKELSQQRQDEDNWYFVPMHSRYSDTENMMKTREDSFKN